MVFISYLFLSPLRSLNIFIIPILKSWFCDSGKLLFWLPITIGLLTSVGGTWPWLFKFVFLFWGLGIWT